MKAEHFMYLDTNIYSYLAGNRQLWGYLREFLTSNGLYLALSEANLLELIEVTNLHNDLRCLLLELPSAAIKISEKIINEEVKAHPNQRTQTLLCLPLNKKAFDRLFTSKEIISTRKSQRQDARQMPIKLTDRMNNFKPSESGKYEIEQDNEFAMAMVIQWLAKYYPTFFLSFRERPLDLKVEVFRSLSLYALTIFHKYYVGRRAPGPTSDFGDLFHLFPIPYCKYAIMERDICHHLRQIKRRHSALVLTEIQNIDFIRGQGFWERSLDSGLKPTVSAAPKRWGFYVNLASCTGCKVCQVACKDKNNLPPGVRWRRVVEVSGGGWMRRGGAWLQNTATYYLSTACHHCEQPICEEVCPTKAITQRADGIVLIDELRCIGCRYCGWACPYGAPQFDAGRGVMTKCDFCVDEVEQGKPPACVQACQMRVLEFGDVEELRAKHGDLIEVYPLPGRALTGPASVLTPHRDCARAEDGSAHIANREEI